MKRRLDLGEEKDTVVQLKQENKKKQQLHQGCKEYTYVLKNGYSTESSGSIG